MDEPKADPEFATKLYEFGSKKNEFEDALDDLGVPFDNIGWDWYDNSLEINKVESDYRLSDEAYKFIFDSGFSICFVNHKDGCETHYSAGKRRGWRRRYVSDPEVTTTRILFGEPDPGYFEVSYWPEGWDKQRGWIDSGYMRVVPDPLDVHADTHEGEGEVPA